MTSSYVVTQWLFLKLLGGVYGVAFWSLLVQVEGLYGSRGILPIAGYVNSLKGAHRKRFPPIPSLFWFFSGDFFLRFCAGLGVVLSLLLIAGILPPLNLFFLWFLYISFVSVGREFLSYQWDALLLETGFMSIFFALVTSPPILVMFAYWFFLFRFIFSAGVVKLTSRDKTWRSLEALFYHYETQPLPNIPGWHAHQLPKMAQKISTLGTFFFELAVPFLALGPGPVRLTGFFLMVFFQGLICLTGNYGFFNVLTVVLAVPLLEDRHLQWISGLVPVPANGAANPVLAGCVSFLFLVFLLLNLLQVVMLFYRPYSLTRLIIFLMRYGISSPYGLFAVMTTDRFEFVVEGSNDQQEWQCYEFKWKPVDPHVPPRQAAPHQPRLDWQMWFAALNPSVIEPWLYNFVERLLEGSRPVLALLRKNPFPDHPPEYIRLIVYRYHFTNRKTKHDTGSWWERTLLGKTSPMSLKQ
jgi:hypothetical protein